MLTVRSRRPDNRLVLPEFSATFFNYHLVLEQWVPHNALVSNAELSPRELLSSLLSPLASFSSFPFFSDKPATGMERAHSCLKKSGLAVLDEDLVGP